MVRPLGLRLQLRLLSKVLLVKGNHLYLPLDLGPLSLQDHHHLLIPLLQVHQLLVYNSHHHHHLLMLHTQAHQLLVHSSLLRQLLVSPMQLHQLPVHPTRLPHLLVSITLLHRARVRPMQLLLPPACTRLFPLNISMLGKTRRLRCLHQHFLQPTSF